MWGGDVLRLPKQGLGGWCLNLMTKKIYKVTYQLDTGEIKSLTNDEIKRILIASDSIIGSGGRTLLSKILKGSKDKKIPELNLNTNPSYGIFKTISVSLILNKIDWLIQNEYLTIEYDGRLPILFYDYKGWEVIKEYKINEIINKFDFIIESGAADFDLYFLKDMNRELIFELLDKICEMNESKKYIPLLKSWHEIDYNKVKRKINFVKEEIKKKYN
jgi:hypothetical protein